MVFECSVSVAAAALELSLLRAITQLVS